MTTDQEEPVYAPEDCAWCLGAGRGRDSKHCPVCKGRGAVLVAQPARACFDCRGSGRGGGLSDGPRCAQCGGAGWKGIYRTPASVRA